ncbi:hypothetical protein, partial [[Eubacterium] hominis]|uniref:hypothetical protein n=1 Tax=[Eubacterium] hominis TaxID=2764325 RepID=UPI003A4DB6E9
MLNIFFCYSVFWSIILLLYSFQWSDLLVQLNINILIFIIFTILMSALTGYLLRDKIKIQKKISETHKSSFTLLLVVFFVLDLLYAGKIPLVYYLENISYHEVNFEGIPIFHNLINSLGIFYSFHLSYLCVCYKKKKYYMENFLIISFYIILLQRQNIFICIIV